MAGQLALTFVEGKQTVQPRSDIGLPVCNHAIGLPPRVARFFVIRVEPDLQLDRLPELELEQRGEKERTAHAAPKGEGRQCMLLLAVTGAEETGVGYVIFPPNDQALAPRTLRSPRSRDC